MKNRILLLLLSASLLYSCKRDIPLKFASDSFTEDAFEICKSIGCPEITINYVQAIGKESVSEKINSEIKAFIIASLTIGEDSIPKAKTIADAASEFIKTYRMHSADFPDMSAEYFAEINVTELYQSSEIISFELRQYLYTGGAHGFGSVAFLNVDSETGNELTMEALISNKTDFTLFCEKKFKLANNIKTDESINSTGFWFEDDTFYLPDTIGFTDTSVILIYNSYEIASYAAGAIELEIPMEEAGPFLTIE
jgi:hypothetical protein